MGVSLSTARYLALASFLYDFAAQQYGMFSSPNMKDVHDANLSFFSPQPFFIAGFFFPQQLVQLAWMYKLWRLRPEQAQEKKEVDEMVRFVPYYALGNVCIGTWVFFWNAGQLRAADAFVVLNTSAQLWYVFTQLAPLDTRSTPSILTHVVAKTFAGIGVLDLLHNTSIAFYKNQFPSTALKVATGLGFGLLSACSDWIFGASLVYDLVALSVGQASYEPGWSRLLGGYALSSAAIVGLKNYFKPPYTGKNDYALTAQDEVDDRV